MENEKTVGEGASDQIFMGEGVAPCEKKGEMVMIDTIPPELTESRVLNLEHKKSGGGGKLLDRVGVLEDGPIAVGKPITTKLSGARSGTSEVTQILQTGEGVYNITTRSGSQYLLNVGECQRIPDYLLPKKE